MDKTIPSLLKLRIDADRIRLSEILALKRLFREHSGKSPIELHFQSGAKRLGVVHVEASWGVKIEGKFKEKLEILAERLGIGVSFD